MRFEILKHTLKDITKDLNSFLEKAFDFGEDFSFFRFLFGQIVLLGAIPLFMYMTGEMRVEGGGYEALGRLKAIMSTNTFGFIATVYIVYLIIMAVASYGNYIRRKAKQKDKK